MFSFIFKAIFYANPYKIHYPYDHEFDGTVLYYLHVFYHTVIMLYSENLLKNNLKQIPNQC